METSIAKLVGSCTARTQVPSWSEEGMDGWLEVESGGRKDSNEDGQGPQEHRGGKNFVFVSSLWMSEVYLTSPLPFFSMSMINMETVLDSELKKRIEGLEELDWFNECDLCRKPCLLHVGQCLRSEEDLPPDKMKELWNEFKSRTRPIMKEVMMERRRAIEKDSLKDSLLEGFKSIMVHVQNENNVNMEKLCGALVKKEETQTKPSRVVKLAKVPTWTKEISLETYRKQIEAWDEVNNDVPPNNKYQDFV